MKLVRALQFIGLSAVLVCLSTENDWRVGLAQAECTMTVQPGESIQKAIDDAAEGAVICLGAGKFEENLVIGKSLTLRGAAKEPKDVQIVGVKEGYPVIRIESANEIEVFIENLTAAGAKGYCAAYDPEWICPNGISVRGIAKVVIENVQISGNSSDGIWIMDSAQVTVSNSVISDNARGCEGGYICMGIDVSGSTLVEISNCAISDNRGPGITVRDSAQAVISKAMISSNGDVGLYVLDSSKVSLGDSTVSDNGFAGFVIADSAAVSLSNSQVFGNEITGFGVLDLARVDLTDSMVSNNGLAGFVVGGSATVSLINSVVSGESLSGFVIADSSTVVLINSRVSSNWELGLGVVDSAKVSLTDSTISDNGVSGLFVGGSANVEIRSSTIEGNGTDKDCKEMDSICPSIAVSGRSQMAITDSRLISNADWGLAAILRQCGYGADNFAGQVVFEGHNVIEGNNKSGKLTGMGNPGNHPFTNLPDGQVCLP